MNQCFSNIRIEFSQDSPVNVFHESQAHDALISFITSLFCMA